MKLRRKNELLWRLNQRIIELVLKDKLESAWLKKARKKKGLDAIYDQSVGHNYGDHEDNFSFNYLENLSS